MKRIFLAIICTLIGIILPVNAQGVTVISTTRAEAEQRADGLYYLVLTGDAAAIARICAVGNCNQAFGSRLDAVNTWSGWIGLAYGGSNAPIPPAPISTAALSGARVRPLQPAWPVCVPGRGCLTHTMA
jgi:hypothetical protein